MNDLNSFDIRDAASAKVLSREEEFFLFGRLRQLEEFLAEEHRNEWVEDKERIVDQIIRHNIRFAVKVAKSFERRSALVLEDLISLSTMGLLSAIDVFDHSSGNKFITYAVWHIRNHIHKALIEDHETSAHFYNRTAGLKIDVATSESLTDAGITSDHIESFLFVHARKMSLDAPLSSDDPRGTTVSDLIADSNTDSPDEEYIQNETKNIILGEVDKLDSRSAYVVKAMHGVGGVNPVNLEQAGRDIGYSREQARKIYVEAIHTLRGSPVLQEYA